MMKGQLAGLMKQAQAMQDNMKKAQEQLASIEVEGQSGAGLVKVVMTCKNDVKRVSIDPSLLADDKDMLEDLVAAAFNDAVREKGILKPAAKLYPHLALSEADLAQTEAAFTYAAGRVAEAAAAA